MARLPFNPAKMAAAPAASHAQDQQAAGTSERPITVSQLAAVVDRVVREHTPATIRVIGEIGQFTERTHWYFSLKDAAAVIGCVMWHSAARRVGFVPKAGQQVLLSGKLEYYPPQGRIQFIADKLEPVGVGALDLAYRQLLEQLKGLGYFESDRKRSLPVLPKKVAIITSRKAAALQDVLDTFARRCPSLPLAFVDVRVQGDGSAAEIAQAIRRVGATHVKLGVDVLLVTRGGGSIEDLWAFNERVVADAIFQCPIPVVAAIGHETDTTIAELVADVRGATPTQAVMRIAPDQAALMQQLRSFGVRLSGLLSKQIRIDAERLRSAQRHSLFADPARLVDERGDDLADLQRGLQDAVRDRLRSLADALHIQERALDAVKPEALLSNRRERLHALRARLERAVTARLSVRLHKPDVVAHRLQAAMHTRVRACISSVDGLARSLDLVGPSSVLARGYSVTTDSQGRVVRSRSQVSSGETMQTRVADGAIVSVVSDQGESHGTKPVQELPTIPPRRRGARDVRPRPQESAPGLFGAEP